MVSRVNNGENGGYKDKHFRLMSDLKLKEAYKGGNSSVMIGTNTKDGKIDVNDNTRFRGTFDGNGHTITLDINDTSGDDYCGLFRFIKDATIKKLHVEGTIVKSSGKYIGGIVGKAEGLNNTISSCRCSVDILSNRDGDASSGGFIGDVRGERVDQRKYIFEELPYDFNLYNQVESGQASIYRLKYVDRDKGQFIFTNDFGFASAGMGWLLVVNQGTVSLNVAATTITAETKSEEVYGYQGPAPTTVPQVAGYWTGTFGRIYDEDAEPLHAYGMRSDGLWQRCRVADNNPRQSWIETFRAYFQTADTYDVDTFTPMYTFTGAADEIETGAVEAFPIDHFVGDLPDGQGTAISPVIRTVEADGTNRYFDLQGRQIGTKPASGVYIKDGKKFISNNNN